MSAAELSAEKICRGDTTYPYAIGINIKVLGLKSDHHLPKKKCFFIYFSDSEVNEALQN